MTLRFTEHNNIAPDRRIAPIAQSQSDHWAYFAGAGALFRDSLVRTYLARGEKEKATEALEELLHSGYERLSHPVIYVKCSTSWAS